MLLVGSLVALIDVAAQRRQPLSQRLRRYATAYLESNGPNREVVRHWLRYLDSRSGG